MTRRILTSALCLLLLTSCAKSEDPVTLSQTAQWQEGNASIVLSLPEDWGWGMIEENADELPDGGIRFFPEDDPEADTVVRYTNGFGVCGTGLKTEKLMLSGGNKVTSYAWDGGDPSIYRFSDAPGDYLAELSLDEGQRKQYLDTVMQILGTAQLGGDVIRASTAVVRTGYTEDEGTRILPEYNMERGVWVIDIHIKKNTGFQLWYTYEVSADGKSIEKTYDINNAKETTK
ncbi:MAG: hypothetical protein E7604_06250 [Ruminococcaceae bacterium]|nr:hypothetical protein [Oscillospiraceae bacterium]